MSKLIVSVALCCATSVPAMGIEVPAYARLKHDIQLAEFDYQSRTAGDWKGRPNTPETVRFYHKSSCRSSGSIGRLSDEWMRFTEEINGEKSFEGLMIPEMGWINTKYDRARRNPAPQMLSFAGNVVEIDEIDRKGGRVRAFYWRETPPYEASWFNYKTYPQFINKFTVVTLGGKVNNPGKGLDMYIPLIRQEELWIPLAKVEWFPPLPQRVCVSGTGGSSLNVWSTTEPESDDDKVDALPYDPDCKAPVTVDKYRPMEGNVWGRIGPERWIALQHYVYGMPDPVFYTSWSMETRPPQPPRSE